MNASIAAAAIAKLYRAATNMAVTDEDAAALTALAHLGLDIVEKGRRYNRDRAEALLQLMDPRGD